TSSHAYSLIGHGGAYVNGSAGSAIAADSAGSVTTTGSAATDGVTLRGGTGDDSFAMIGSGGRDFKGTITGAVNVTAGAGGSILAGGGSRAFAQVGHGGYNGAGATGVYTINAAPVTVNTGLVDLR